MAKPLTGFRKRCIHLLNDRWTAAGNTVYPIIIELASCLQGLSYGHGIKLHRSQPGHKVASVLRFPAAMNLPLTRDAMQYDGYIEGWALYAERLMWELGVYQDDPAGNLGRLTMELLRAIRCVVDTGIHYKKWTFNQAIQYNLQARGSRYEGEVLRYIMCPAQSTSYYVGFLKILELRKKAKDRLDSRFDLKEFHRILLGSGQVPLALLDHTMDNYIAGRQASPVAG